MSMTSIVSRFFANLDLVFTLMSSLGDKVMMVVISEVIVRKVRPLMEENIFK